MAYWPSLHRVVVAFLCLVEKAVGVLALVLLSNGVLSFRCPSMKNKKVKAGFSLAYLGLLGGEKQASRNLTWASEGIDSSFSTVRANAQKKGKHGISGKK